MRQNKRLPTPTTVPRVRNLLVINLSTSDLATKQLQSNITMEGVINCGLQGKKTKIGCEFGGRISRNVWLLLYLPVCCRMNVSQISALRFTSYFC